MNRFHVAIHATPQATIAREPREIAGRSVSTLSLRPEHLTRSIPVSFEAALAALERLPRMFIEPDGSFVWVGEQGESAWQLDGVLFDRAGELVYVELKGTCPSARFDELLTTLGWPQVQFVFQLAREALFLDEAEFRRWTEFL